MHHECENRLKGNHTPVSNIKLPPYTRRIWYYDKADLVAIMKSIEMFHLQEHLICPNEQIELLNEVLFNIFSNFIPNKVKMIRPHQAPWITEKVKNFLRRRIMPTENS